MSSAVQTKNRHKKATATATTAEAEARHSPKCTAAKTPLMEAAPMMNIEFAAVDETDKKKKLN